MADRLAGGARLKTDFFWASASLMEHAVREALEGFVRRLTENAPPAGIFEELEELARIERKKNIFDLDGEYALKVFPELQKGEPGSYM